MMILLRESSRDWALVALVSLLTLGANLPSSLAENLNIDQRWFLGGLIAVVGVALVRYLKLALLLVVVLLAVGANLPTEIADKFGVDPQIMLLGLLAMVVISLSNRIWKLPSGVQQAPNPKSPHGVAALFNAILKGRIAIVQTLLKQGVNVNIRTVSGKTPMMAAAYKGYGDIVQILLDHKANATQKDAKGNTALKIAQQGGYTRVVQILQNAGVKE